MKVNFKNRKDTILSIGMIVKNEEKVLDRCLKSLVPLMNEIPSELIIADTGSVDSTMEIALKYTENVFSYEWNNDFAAARNSTLDKAHGMWYMYIDADEYLDEDISELIYFFKHEELYRKYKTGELIIRSFTDSFHTKYSDARLGRFQRINDKDDPVKFIGRIHETIYIRKPTISFDTVLFHTGYEFSSRHQNYMKKKRNLDIMRREYQDNPNDLRLLCHLVDGCVFEQDEQEKYVKESLELVKSRRNDFYANSIYVQSINFYKDTRPEYALELCDEYCETLNGYKKYIATIAVYIQRAKILLLYAKYKEAHFAFLEYYRLYEQYNKGELIEDDISARPVEGLTFSEYLDNVIHDIYALKMLKRFEEAHELLRKIDVSKLECEDYRRFLGTVRDLCKEEKNYFALVKYFNKFYQSDNKMKRELSLTMMETTYYSLFGTEKRKNYAEILCKSGVKNLYIDLMSLVLSEEDENFKERLITFLNSVDEWKEGYSEAIYLALKYNIDFTPYIEKMNTSVFNELISSVTNGHDDFGKVVSEYEQYELYMNNIHSLLWITTVYQYALKRAYSLNNSQKNRLYSVFCLLISNYVLNIYNPELLNDDDVLVVPELHRFGYYIFQADLSINNGDDIGYIKNLKKALVNCESMKDVVEFFFEQYKCNRGEQ